MRKLLVIAALLWASTLDAKESIRLVNNPALSPQGKLLAFDWNGDIWVVPSTGGNAKPLTQNPAKDRQPKWSPDGKQIAFISDREGSPQVFVMSSEGGTPKQLTNHTSGYSLLEWTADGNSLLVSSTRDHAWRHAERFYRINVKDRGSEEMLFDDYGANGTLSPDGKKLLFTREGVAWWRKGYRGSQSGQIWFYDLGSKRFANVKNGQESYLWPMWTPDGNFFYVSDKTGGPLNLWFYDSKANQDRQLTPYSDEAVVFPCISRDGTTIVYRHLFDLYRIEPEKSTSPSKIEIFHDDDRSPDRMERRTLERANGVSFTNDGLEIAFTSGGDLWVMDTELKEPKRITTSPEEERSPLFTPDGQAILFVSDKDGKTDIWKATRADSKKPWFLTDEFKLERFTNDGEIKSGLSFSPDGSKLAYIRGRGDLWVANADGKNAVKVIESWNTPDYDWSPDAKWLVYALSDNDFNRDIWIKPIDGSRAPVNISRHPYNESDPVWSPDGKIIAFVGDRERKGNADIHYVFLREEDDERSTRDKTLEKALEKLQKGRNTTPSPFGKRGPTGGSDEAEQEPGPTPREVKNFEEKKSITTPKKSVEVIIDFEGIHDRIRRVRIDNTNETNLLWSPDSKKLAFTAFIDGQSGLYTLEIPDNLRPTSLSSQIGTQAKWLKNNTIVWLSSGVPGSISGVGSGATTPTTRTPTTTPTTPTPKGPRGGLGGGGVGASAAPGGYRFQAYQEFDLAKKHQAAFDMCWRTMRDNWYDERLGNRDWSRVREKYLPMAETPDTDALTQIVQMMLGELNGSHLGFTVSGGGPIGRGGPTPLQEEPTGGRWRKVTAHLGVRFIDDYKGPGLRIRDVIPDGPADQKKSKLSAGEIILQIDGKEVNPSMDLTSVLNGVQNRVVHLKVRDGLGKERDVTLQSITYQATRPLLYQAWIKDNLKQVGNLSKNSLGYLHVAAMNMDSFYKFEEELYNAGAGKDGLIIDVRENGGGSTADHLLTALTQPQHAIAVPRGGGSGYPQDRTVYATWNKPIVVMCNQNSFSNAEIFSHAIKTLKRGHLVGVPTAGGVISTGAAQIMDIGVLRLPTRGWFVVDSGEDMELKGAVPDVIVWPFPGEMPQGKDVQLEKAADTLLKDVQNWKNRPQPKLKKATER
jgi:tricorn protease